MQICAAMPVVPQTATMAAVSAAPVPKLEEVKLMSVPMQPH